MDFKKNQFYIIIGVVMVVLLAIHFLYVGSIAEKIQAEAQEVSNSKISLERLNRKKPAEMRNKDWVDYYKQRKAKLKAEWDNCIEFYAKRDVDFEKYLPQLQGNFTTADFFLRYKTRWNDMIGNMRSAGITFADKYEDTGNPRGFNRLKKEPPTQDIMAKTQKKYWIKNALISAMIANKGTKFVSTKINHKETKKIPSKSGFKFTPPFHFYQTMWVMEIPYKNLHGFLAAILKHPYLNISITNMKVEKAPFQYRYKTYSPSGFKRDVFFPPDPTPYFGQHYIFVRFPKSEYDSLNDSKLRKMFPMPSVKVTLTMDVLDFDKALAPSDQELMGGGRQPAAKGRRGRRSRRAPRRRRR